MRYQTKREIGDLGERIARRYLLLHGYWIRERNYFAGRCEIDIIAATPRDLAFVEVKTRTYDRGIDLQTAPPPSLAVDAAKQEHTRRAALQYLRQTHCRKQPRMDVIEVWLEKPDGRRRPRLLKLHHIKAAY